MANCGILIDHIVVVHVDEKWCSYVTAQAIEGVIGCDEFVM